MVTKLAHFDNSDKAICFFKLVLLSQLNVRPDDLGQLCSGHGKGQKLNKETKNVRNKFPGCGTGLFSISF